MPLRKKLQYSSPIVSFNIDVFSIRGKRSFGGFAVAKYFLASAGLLCEERKSTLGIRHSQFAYTTDGSILRSASMSRGGAECLFFFCFTDSWESIFFSLSLLSETTRHNTSKTDCQLLLAAMTKSNIIITACTAVFITNHTTRRGKCKTIYVS